MAKQKSNAQAATGAPAGQVHVAITGNAAHDGVEYVINTHRLVDRAIAEVLCELGVAQRVYSDEEAAAQAQAAATGAELNDPPAKGDEAGSSAAADPAEPTEPPADAAASDGV